MNKEKLVENCGTDPNSGSKEKGMTISFVKEDDKANISSGIKSQVKKAINHTDITVNNIQVYYEDDETYELMPPEDYVEGTIVSFKGTVPIESLKIQSNPRSSRSYSQIISGQTEVNIDAE